MTVVSDGYDAVTEKVTHTSRASIVADKLTEGTLNHPFAFARTKIADHSFDGKYVLGKAQCQFSYLIYKIF